MADFTDAYTARQGQALGNEADARRGGRAGVGGTFAVRPAREECIVVAVSRSTPAARGACGPTDALAQLVHPSGHSPPERS